MNKKINLLLLGIALVGVLIYFLSSGPRPETPPVVTYGPGLPVSDDPSVAAQQFRAGKRPSAQESTGSIADDKGASSTVISTQELQVPALEPEIRDALDKMLNTSSEGLVEETSNGGTSVDLQGRFRTAPVATVDEHGNVQVTDYSHLPQASAQP